MREEFSAIVNGWDLISGFNAITDRIEEIAKWQKENGPLQEDEEKIVELMFQCQIARGFEEGIEKWPYNLNILK